MKSVQGVILIMVLLFLQLLALMSLFAMRLAWIEMKSNQSISQSHITYYLAQEALDHVEKIFDQVYLECRIPVTQTANLLRYPFSWWEVEACSGTLLTLKYYYKIEALGEDPCAKIQILPSNGSALTANYMRITLMGITTHSTKIVLQSTIVKPLQSLLSCAGMKHTVMPGRQTQREINVT